MQRKKGFTLIELLVVVAIIGILATVIILNVTSARAKAADAKVKNDVSTIARAAKTHQALGGTFPDTSGSQYQLGVDLTSDPAFLESLTDNGNNPGGTKLIPTAPVHPVADKYYRWFSQGSKYMIAGDLVTEPTKAFYFRNNESGIYTSEDISFACAGMACSWGPLVLVELPPI